MVKTDAFHPDGYDQKGFLYSFVGEDRNGFMVTVLSTLARLGLDPWKEASELAELSEGAALTRLGVLLEKFSDVPALSYEHETVARKLVPLLSAPAAHAPSQGDASPNRGRLGAFLTTSAIAMFVILLAKLLLTPGAG